MNLILHQLILGTTAGAPLTGGGAATAASPDGLLFVALALVFAGVILFLLEVPLSPRDTALLSASSLVGSVGDVPVQQHARHVAADRVLHRHPSGPVLGPQGLEGLSVGHKLILEPTPRVRTTSCPSSLREMRRPGGSIKNIGKFGVADSTLRPVGSCHRGERLDAIAEGEVIERGQRVEVVDATITRSR